MAGRSTSPDIESSRDIEALHEKHDMESNAPTLNNAYMEEKESDGSVQVRNITFETTTSDLPQHPSISIPDLSAYASPFEWSSSRKTICLILSCAATLMGAYSAGSYSIAIDPLRAKFDISPTVFQTGVTIWCVGFASSPMLLAPLSELNGRRPVFLCSGLLFLISLIGCAVTESFAGMLLARFFVGAGASTFATMVGGVISDVYHAEDRNAPMAIYSTSALAGTGLGPLVCGFIVPRVSWRWVFWHQAIYLVIIMLFMIVFFKETRGSVLLKRKAATINKYLAAIEEHNNKDTTIETATNHKSQQSTPSTRYIVPGAPDKSDITHLIYLSLTTPFKLLFTEPVVFFFSLWAAFAWAVLYLQLSVIPLVFSTIYGFDTQQTGLIFTSLVVGVIIALLLSITQERLARRYFPKLLSSGPEGRLYFACLEAALLPIGLFWFGWTSFRSIHWIVPCLGLATAMMGIFTIYLAVFNYLADVYHRYASSALACQSFCRNILAAVFPLFSTQMFRRLGFPAASSLLGGVAAVLTVVPWVLVFKGEAIRRRSKVAREGMGL